MKLRLPVPTAPARPSKHPEWTHNGAVMKLTLSVHARSLGLSLCATTNVELKQAARLLNTGSTVYLIVPGTERNMDKALARLGGPHSVFPDDKLHRYLTRNPDSKIRMIKKPPRTKSFESVTSFWSVTTASKEVQANIKVSFRYPNSDRIALR